MRVRLLLLLIMMGALFFVAAFPGTGPQASVYDGQDYDYGPAGVNTTTTVIKTTSKTSTVTTNNLEVNDFDDFQDLLEENWLLLVFIIIFGWIIFSAVYKIQKRNN